MPQTISIQVTAKSIVLALTALAGVVIVASVEGHVVYPKLVGDIVGLHRLTIIVALFIGAEAKGVQGTLLAVPVAIVLQVFFDHFYRFEPAATAVEPLAVEEHAVVRTQLTHTAPKSRGV